MTFRRGVAAPGISSVRVRIMLLASLSCVACLVGTLQWRQGSLARATELLVAQGAEKDALVGKIIALMGQSVETLARDYTQWDDMGALPKKRDLVWAKESFESTLATYGVDSVCAYSLEGELLFSCSTAEAEEAESKAADGGSETPAHGIDRPPPFDPRPMLEALKHEPFSHAFARSGEEWIELRGAAIHAGADVGRKGKSHGYFIVGRRWAGSFMAQFAEVVGAEVRLKSRGDPASESRPELGFLSNSVDLPGYGAEPGPRLDVVTHRPAIVMMNRETERAVALLAGGLTSLLLVVFVALVVWVTRPLSALGESLRTGSRAPLAHLMAERSEFGDAARLVRDFFQQQQVLAEARDAAQSAVRSKSAFLANMSHEIRTPLNGVIGMAEHLASTSLAGDQRDAVDTIVGSSRMLLDILNDILDLSKIETGKLRIESEPFDLRKALEDTAGLFAPKARAKGVVLHVRTKTDVPKLVRGDVTRIRQIASNLVGNALKFTDCGHIRLEARLIARGAEADDLEIAVTDSGIGIPKDRFGAIFESFTQADDTTTRKYGGTGLGLTISRQLADAMGGFIAVESVVGKGSIFRVRFHCGRVDAAPDAEATKPELPGRRVLVVSDAAIGRRIAAELLAAEGAEVESANAANAGAALARAASQGSEFACIVALDDVAVETTRPITRFESPLRRDVFIKAVSHALGVPSKFESADSKPAASVADLSGLRVLLAEDNVVNRKVAIKVLGRWNIVPVVAEDGAQALEAWRAASFDVILMDCQMPVLDGFESATALRAEEAATGRARTRIVAMTANVMQGDRERCLAAGMDDYLAKPFAAGALLEVLTRVGVSA